MMPGKQLREYVRLVAGKNIPNGKADTAAVFQRNFLERLDHFWKKLSPMRFMRASNLHFQLTNSPDDFYISDEKYGALSHRAAI
jgi:hypothetical protein